MRASLVTWASLTLLVGCKPAPVVEPPPPAPTVVAFSATPVTVRQGEPVTLSWETKDATSVELRGADGVIAGATDLSGNVQVNVMSDTLFLLVANNARGVRDSAAVWVDVDDAVTDAYFTVSPSRVRSGEPVTLAWHAPGAKTVSLAVKGGAALDLGGQFETGSVDVNPVFDTTWVLTVDGKAREVSVATTPIIDVFQSSPASAQPGQPLQLSWKTQGAKRVTLSLAGKGDLLTESDAGKVADGSFSFDVPANMGESDALTFELSAETDSSSSLASTQVFRAGVPRVTRWTVPGYALTGSSFEVSWETIEADVVEILRDGVVVYRSPTVEVAENGSTTFPTPPVNQTFQLRALNTRGGEALSGELVVNPVGLPDPAISTFTASVSNIANGGEPVTLTWNVPNARNLKIVAKGQFNIHTVVGLAAETGSIVVYPNRDTEYVLSGDNGFGSKVKPISANVTVTTPARLLFGPDDVPIGANVHITGTTIPGAGGIEPLNFAAENVGNRSFIDISTTGAEIVFPPGGSTDLGQMVQLPEKFETTWRGVTVGDDSISVNQLGWFVFSPKQVNNSDGPPDKRGAVSTWSGPQSTLLPGPNTHVYWQVDGTGNQQRLIVQWSELAIYPLSDQKSVTMQAQLYSNGEVVLAYPKVQLFNADQHPTIGVLAVDGDFSAWIRPAAGQLTQRGMPEQGDVFTLMTKLPSNYLHTASMDSLRVSVEIGNNNHIIIDTAVKIVPPGATILSEAMANPPTGSTNGEWVEITNNTSTPFELGGWDLDFGGGSKHTIAGTVTVPPNGRVVLGQASTSAGTATVNYVYGPGFTLPKNGSPLVLSKAGGKYDSLKFDLGGTVAQGYSVQRGAVTGGMNAPWDLTSLVCTAGNSSTYAPGAYGTPGAPNSTCPTYLAASSIPVSFEALATNGGTQLVLTSGNANNAIEPLTLPVPVRFGGLQFSTVYVSTNGYLTLLPLTCANATCFSDNAYDMNSYNRLPVGAIAPFWDDLSTDTGGIYWKRGTDYTVISWENVRRPVSGHTYSLNFQVKFFDSGNIEFHFGTMSGTGSGGYPSSADAAKGASAATWLEIPQGGAAFMVNQNSTFPGIAQNSAYRFTAQ